MPNLDFRFMVEPIEKARKLAIQFEEELRKADGQRFTAHSFPSVFST